LPAFAVLTIPISFVPLPAAKTTWFIASAALIAVLAGIAIRLVPERRRSTAFLAVVMFIVLGKFFGHELILGQVNILFGVLAVAGVLAMKNGNEALAGALIGLTIAVKPYGVLFLPWLPARGKISSVIAAVATASGVALLPVAIYGWSETIAL